MTSLNVAEHSENPYASKPDKMWWKLGKMFKKIGVCPSDTQLIKWGPHLCQQLKSLNQGARKVFWRWENEIKEIHS